MYKTAYNAQPHEGQTFTQPSKTIQGQTLSIAEMLQRIQNGIPVTLSSMEYGEDEEPQPLIKDLTDIDQMMWQVNSFQQKLDDIQKANAKAGAEKNKSIDTEERVILDGKNGASEG